MPLPIRIVLVGTSHPGNIGAVARAMKTMGMQRLVLVAPKVFPAEEASARAAGAVDVLESARVCAGLDEALAGASFVVGASARLRSLAWPSMAPREAAARIVAETSSGEAAVVFGRENSGLTNEELARCHALLHIPTAPALGSLNLAMAVQVVAYELFLASGAAPALPPDRAQPAATAEEMEKFYEHLETALIAAKFLDPDNPRHLMRRLRRLFNRAQPDSNEVNILRGILAALASGRR
jgi:TrmH family RNA methyltransferase